MAKIKTQKEVITDSFNQLKKRGYSIKNRNSYRAMPKGMNSDTDLMITGNGIICFFEVKILKDTLKENQIKLAKELIEVCKNNNTIFYSVVNEKEYLEYIDLLIGRRFKLLMDYCRISWQKNKLI